MPFCNLGVALGRHADGFNFSNCASVSCIILSTGMDTVDGSGIVEVGWRRSGRSAEGFRVHARFIGLRVADSDIVCAAMRLVQRSSSEGSESVCLDGRFVFLSSVCCRSRPRCLLFGGLSLCPIPPE